MTLLNRKTLLIALAAPGLAIAAPAAAAAPGAGIHSAPVQMSVLGDINAQHKDHSRGRGHSHRYDSYGYRGRDDRGRNYEEPVYRDTRIWRGRDGRYYCRKEDGTTGLLIGAAVGGLIGNEVAGRGDKTLGAILGAAGGAILGRAIDRSNSRCR